ncbi:putative 2'-deoxynucleoside 5'-phosphate N-hydrolase 1 [Aplysia californica]|uniref:Putative 2'-deoxynucleoside 5'-phosphate N-hydrolase 1 n=1 Tax=Aplysia californica TaxID=6500 RepID=A0ABM0K5M3_APLCA|nr:putative 2'-deoxynucleoside 5'-phosphate N-hydrolase 1 [Aplysia californica]
MHQNYHRNSGPRYPSIADSVDFIFFDFVDRRVTITSGHGKKEVSMKIYFAGSIRGGRQDVGIYFSIIQQLKDNYGEVLTEFVGDKDYSIDDPNRMPDKEIHDTDVGMLSECDCVVAEVTQPSLGVGYELGRAVAMGKRILCLFRTDEGKRLSGMISGAHNGKSFIVVYYKEQSEIPAILKNFFAAS